MDNHVGQRVMWWAELMIVIGIVCSVIGALALFMSNLYVPAILIGAVGCLGSWIGGLVTYAFGSIAENTEKQTATLKQLYEEQKKTNECLVQLQKAMQASSDSYVGEGMREVSEYLPEL